MSDDDYNNHKYNTYSRKNNDKSGDLPASLRAQPARAVLTKAR